LAEVPSSVAVIIPRYPSPVLKQKLLKGGPREIIELAQWQVHEIAQGFPLNPRNFSS